VALVTILSAVAALAGYQAELMAAASVTNFTFKGDSFTAEWANFSSLANSSSSAYAFNQSGVTGPGKPQPVGMAQGWIDVDIANPDGTFLWTEVDYSNSSLPNNFVSTNFSGPGGGTGSFNFSSVGTLWTYDGTNTTTVPVMVSGNASASATASENLQQRIHYRSRLGVGAMFRTHSVADDPTTATGSGGIAVTDAMGNPLPNNSIPAGTATTWNDFESVSNGQIQITK
jgi:hypothetical protein